MQHQVGNGAQTSSVISRHQNVVALALFVGAFILRFFLARSFISGDEPATLAEARELGTNLQSLPYYAALHFWLQITSRLVWIRVFHVFIGSLAVVACWQWLKDWRGEAIAFITSFLLVISPVAVEYSQQARFYSYFMLTGIVFIWSYTRLRFAESSPSLLDWLLLICSSIFFGTAHFVAFVPIAFTLVHFLVTKRDRIPIWAWAVVLLGVALAGTIAYQAITNPLVLQPAFDLFNRVQNGNANRLGASIAYTQPRGWSVVIVAKLTILVFHLVFGQFTYPFDFLIVLPGLLLVGLLVFFAVRRLVKQEDALALYLLVFPVIASVLVIYAIFDPLLPANVSASANVRLVLWAVPIILWLIVEGIYSINTAKFRAVGIAGMTICSAYGLWNFHQPTWSEPDYAGALELVQHVVEHTDHPLLVTEGRAQELLTANLGVEPGLSMWDLAFSDIDTQLINERRSVLIASNNEGSRCELNRVYQYTADYEPTAAFVSYPVFVYVYDAQFTAPNKSIPLPSSVFHPRYEDLRLPEQVNWGGVTYTIHGGFSPTDCRSSSSWTSELSRAPSVRSVVLFSNYASESRFADGTVIARVRLLDVEGNAHVIDIRSGFETQSWSARECGVTCEAVLEWHKKRHLRGERAYSGVYQEFDAHIWASDLPLDEVIDLRRVTVEVVADAEFMIWGLHIVDQE